MTFLVGICHQPHLSRDIDLSCESGMEPSSVPRISIIQSCKRFPWRNRKPSKEAYVFIATKTDIIFRRPRRESTLIRWRKTTIEQIHVFRNFSYQLKKNFCQRIDSKGNCENVPRRHCYLAHRTAPVHSTRWSTKRPKIIGTFKNQLLTLFPKAFLTPTRAGNSDTRKLCSPKAVAKYTLW